MNTIKNNIENTIIIKNSKFICCLYKINSIEEVNNYLDKVKTIYKDATHYCYAYIIDNYKKFSDDNEPGGTAGNPILQVLQKNNLNYILCIVIRYFGGIKLGAGGLVRAYSKSVSNALNNTTILSLYKGKEAIITFNYDKVNIVDKLIPTSNIIEKKFNQMIEYKVKILDEDINKLDNIANINIIKDVYIEK